MPLHKVKPRVRFQQPSKKTRQGDGTKTKEKRTRIFFDDASRSSSFGSTVDNVFEKKRVPSTDELGDLLRSNLSTSLAAEKAYLDEQNAQYSSPLPSRQHVEQVQEDHDSPPVSLLKLAPLFYAASNHPETTERVHVTNEVHHTVDSPLTSSLVTTVIYAPLKDCHRGEALAQESLPPPEGNTQAPFSAHSERARLFQGDITSAADSCAIEEDDEEEDNATWSQSSTELLSVQKHQPTFLKRVINLFAGRRRGRDPNEFPQKQARGQEDSTTPLSSCPQPSVGSPCCSVCSNDGEVAPTPLRREPSDVSWANVHKNLPSSPPIAVPKSQRPYRPLDKGLNRPVIKPAKDHKLLGTYYVVPDIFCPEEVQVGFPGALCTPLTHLPPNEARFLDRANTVWGKWYAKHPKAEDMPFATVYNGPMEATEQDVWDIHVAAHTKFGRAPAQSTLAEEEARNPDEEEYEHAERSRYHTGHCFGALTGFCYPFQNGLIV